MIELEDKIDEILLEDGILKLDKLKEAWSIQKKTGQKLEDVLREQNFVTNKDICAAKAKSIGVEFLDLDGFELNGSLAERKIPKSLALKHNLMPVDIAENKLIVAMADPGDIFALDDLRIAANMEIKPVYAEPDQIKTLIDKFYEEKKLHEPFIEPVSTELSKNQPAIKKVAKALEKESENLSYMNKSILKLLTEEGLITIEQLDKVLDTHEGGGGRIADILDKEKIIEKKTLYEMLEKRTGMPCIELTDMNIPEEILSLMNERLSRRYLAIPLEKDGMILKVAMSDPANIFSIDDMRLATGMEIYPVLAEPSDIEEFLEKRKPKDAKDKKNSAGLKDAENNRKPIDLEAEIKKINEEIDIEIHDDSIEETVDVSTVQNAPIVKMVNLIFSKAVHSRSSDIHIEPYEDCVLVRNRIDGQLVEVMKQDRKIHPALIARIKIISGLNIAEKRLPQDGRISIKIDNREFDMRVSILPTMFGEKAVIRLADKEGFNMGKQELGFFEDDLQKFDSILAHPHGIVLVTGPTGSGKSTTLYTALKELCKPNINILTVEDPVECTIRGINQVQVNSKAGLNFAAALRSFLRQDPDIIMVGEIRDGETADIAMRAAITGHLVLSTLHTNDAASTITRMVDMGVEPYMISSSLVGVIAQRLVRRLCTKCLEEYSPNAGERMVLKVAEEDDVKIKKAVGCPECNNTGYKGRIAIYEIMIVSNDMVELISRNSPANVIKESAVRNGMKTLRDNCSKLVLQGVTTMDELFRVTYAPDGL
ncbi:MAG: ATPase, T2SS/T4P/T4SS family [Clostridiaceae bacterium]